jgi:hypothetical protein
LKKHLASKDRRFLIVIDDVWEPEELRPLMVDGPQSRVLITGRESQVLDQAGVLTERIEVPVMTEEKCLAVVEKHVGALGRDKPEAVEFLNRVGYLPMAVEIGAGLAWRLGLVVGQHKGKNRACLAARAEAWMVRQPGGGAGLE